MCEPRVGLAIIFFTGTTRRARRDLARRAGIPEAASAAGEPGRIQRNGLAVWSISWSLGRVWIAHRGSLVLASVCFRCQPETPLELTIEVLLAPVAQIQRHRFHLHSGANFHRPVHHARTRDIFVNRHTDFLVKQPAEVPRLSSECLCECPESESLSVVPLNLIEHSLDVLMSRGRTWHTSPLVAETWVSISRGGLLRNRDKAGITVRAFPVE